jgi:hypothetical protein
MLDIEYKIPTNIQRQIQPLNIFEPNVEMLEISFGVFIVGGVRLSPNSHPICLDNKLFSNEFCNNCDWYIPQECPLGINYYIREYLNLLYKSILESEYKSWYENRRILEIAREFLSNSYRPRHHAVIAYEIKQKYPEITIGKYKVLNVLRKFPNEFIENNKCEFQLINK